MRASWMILAKIFLMITLGSAWVALSGADERPPKPRRTTTTTIHVNLLSSKAFSAVIAAIDQQLGKLDGAALGALMSGSMSPSEIEAKIHAMEGSSGLMLFAVRDHGQLLSLKGKTSYGKQYELGNPLIAAEMTGVDLRAGEYAPLRMYIYVGPDAMTHIDYDLPSSVLARFKSPVIAQVAARLDHKMEVLVDNALRD
jgi:hypothetical protein